MRNTPRSLVTASNVFPEASCTATIETPGRTAPVESVIVPVIVASCAYAATGSASIALTKKSRVTTRQLAKRIIGSSCRDLAAIPSDDDPGSARGHVACPLSHCDNDRLAAVLQSPYFRGGVWYDEIRVKLTRHLCNVKEQRCAYGNRKSGYLLPLA